MDGNASPSEWVGNRVRLRGLEPADWEAFKGFDEFSDEQRDGWRLAPPRSAEGWRKWATEGAGKDLDLDKLWLVIESRADQVPVGFISTHAIDQHNGTFEYGVMIGRPYHRNGYGSEAIVLLLRYMFGERRFQKVNAGVWAGNEGSLAMHIWLGFVEEGRQRRVRYTRGRYEDGIWLGMTIEEFDERHGLMR